MSREHKYIRQNQLSFRTDEVLQRHDLGVRRSGRSWTCCLAIAVLLALTVRTFAVNQSQSVLKGQSLTILPSGLVLLAGGYDATGTPSNKLTTANSNGTVATLSATLSYARAGHTATVLPDGRVLIFGGYGKDGKLVPIGEMFDPVSGTVTSIRQFRVLPRAFHTATVLTDGTFVVIGGIGAGGELVPDVQVWDYRTGSTLAYNAGLSVPRQQHTATLQSDGNVRISAGLDRYGRPVDVVEEYDPQAHKMSVSSSDVLNAAASVADSIPQDGASEVSITDILAVRFSNEMSVLSLNSNNVILRDSNGNSIAATITGAEAGRLLFVVPTTPLQFGTTYFLTLDNVTDVNANPLPAATIQFRTQGDPQDSSDEEWIPGPGDFNGQWHSHTGPSEWQKLPALQARPGITALSGQVLRLNGRPLQHVLLQVDGQHAFSDRTGRFLVSNIHGGHHVLLIDGRAANRPGIVYGLFEVGVDITVGKTNILNYTVWMTKLDMSNAVNIPSPTVAQDTVITTPRLPGLELHLPQNTVIIDHDGHPVRQLTITPVPLDKPPFPLPPGVQVPIYFTIQPGGSYIDVRSYSSGGAKGARLIYPNPYHAQSGTDFSFWNYDADAKGWYVYGHGKVNKAGTSVVPDPGVVVYELTGAMVGYAGGPFPFPPVKKKCKDGDCDKHGGGVDLSTGNYSYSDTDLDLQDTLPIDLTRTYRSNDSVSRAFGIGTTMNYDFYMTGDQHPYSYQELIGADGSRVRFDRVSTGESYTDAVYLHSSDQDAFYGSTVTFGGKLCGSWSIRQNDGTVTDFPDSDSQANYRLATPCAISDRYGNSIMFSRDANGNLLQVTSPNGRYIQFTYDASNRVIKAEDNIGRTTSYSYDSAGRLGTVTDANGNQKSYTYDSNNNLLSITNGRNITTVTNQYDSAGRVVQQTLADGGTYLYSWTPTENTSEVYAITDPNGAAAGGVMSFRNCSTCSEGYSPVIAQVDVTNPRGYVRRVVFDTIGRDSNDIRALGQPEQQTFSYNYYADNLLYSTTDALGRVTSYSYDASGNVTLLTDLSGTQNASTSTARYDGTFSRLLSLTDPLNNSTTFSYDATGNLTAITDALQHQTTRAYDAQGRVVSSTDPLSNTVTFNYFLADLASVTDPLERATTRATDAAGRVTAVTDAMGHTTKLTYNNLDEITSTSDPLGSLTSFTYDQNGNLLTVTDANQHTTTYVYDAMNRVQMRSDPLLRQETYTYDLAGNLVTFTDRRGKVANFSYDGLDRRTFAGFGRSGTSYESTVSYTYDSGDRLARVSDSIAGDIVRVYDLLDRVTSETTPQGTINYTYDAAGRRRSMTVSGQAQITYTYDNANRVTQISQGANNIYLSYDSANRRTSLSLPNGIVINYSYDNASELTGLSYQFGANTLGNVTYEYDRAGRRVQLGGNFANTSLPTAVNSASYDQANELTNWGGATLSYDGGGNLQNDGIHSYTWNARNQLSSIDFGNTASFTYDAFGRRAGKSIGGAFTSFLYDNSNVVQELSGTAPTVNLVTGGLDEYFTRSTSGALNGFLTDALGSTLAVSDSSGNLQTRYTFEPFGNSTISGAASANEMEYTGRENDGTGLYFYRARYYNPEIGRFISEDPLRFDGGENFYAYVDNSPTNLVDPLGLLPRPVKPYRWRYCKGSEVSACKQICRFEGKEYGSCRVSQTYRIGPGGLAVGPDWIDGPLSCSCKDRNECGKATAPNPAAERDLKFLVIGVGIGAGIAVAPEVTLPSLPEIIEGTAY